MAGSKPTGPTGPTGPASPTTDLHRRALVFDGHCDSLLDAVGLSETEPGSPPRDLALRSARGHIDLPRLVEAGVSAQFFAVFCPDARVGMAGEHSRALIRALDGLCERSPLALKALRADDARRAKAEGRVAAFLAIEGGEAIGESLDELRAFYGAGVRLMTLTWNRRNAIARGVGTPGDDGLSPFGRRVVAEMERLGMIVDVSHLSDRALDEVLDASERPLVASHSNAKAVLSHRRNLSDDQLERIAATGGLVGLTMAGVFVDAEPARVGLSRLMDHLDHMLGVVGDEHVGLGTDFDGFTAPYGLVMDDCTGLPLLTQAMIERGYSEDTILKILGGNWLRVVEEVVG